MLEVLEIFLFSILKSLSIFAKATEEEQTKSTLPLILMKIILACASLNPPRSSIGRGKMIVLFFSAEIECNVCKYLEGL